MLFSKSEEFSTSPPQDSERRRGQGVKRVLATRKRGLNRWAVRISATFLAIGMPLLLCLAKRDHGDRT